MAAKHKLSGSHVRISTAKTGEGIQLLRIAKQVADDLTSSRGRSTGLKTFQFGWHVEKVGQDSLLISMGNDRKSSMKFKVNVVETADSTVIATSIVFFRTLQSKVMLIPAGPKRLVGYESYKRYMVALGQAVEAWDPQASVSITERVR